MIRLKTYISLLPSPLLFSIYFRVQYCFISLFYKRLIPVEFLNVRFIMLYLRVVACTGYENLQRNYHYHAYFYQLQVLPYNTITLIMLNWVNVYSNVIWLFSDGFILIICVYLAGMFNCINETISSFKLEKVRETNVIHF